MERGNNPDRTGRPRTPQQRSGDAAERLVAERLRKRGWTILASNVHVGRSELDLVAVDPGPPARLVVVEVRYRRSKAFGRAEETFDTRKQGRLRRGVGRLLESGRLPDGTPLPALPIALDLAVVEADTPEVLVRLYRNALFG